MAIDQTTEQEQTRTYTPEVAADVRDFIMQSGAFSRENRSDDAPPERLLLTGGDPDALAKLPGSHKFYDKGGYRIDFCRAPEVADLAARLIHHYPEFTHLRGLRIAYLWRRKKQAKAGKLVLGTCSSLSGIPQAFLEADWAVTIGAESCREAKLTAYQLEALVYHELCHIAPPDEDDPESVPTLTGHDFEGFADELRRYGLWDETLAQARDAFDDLPLFAGMVG